MKSLGSFLLALPVLFSSCSSVTTESALVTRLRPLAATAEGQTIAIAYRSLDLTEEAVINGEVAFHAASTMKVPVMLEVFRQLEAGMLGSESDGRLVVRNRFESIVDGSPYQLSKDDDSDQDLYDHLSEAMAIKELVRRMIVRSSNLATNLLIAEVWPESVMGTLARLGAARETKVRRGVEDLRAFEAGLNNETSARDLLEMFTALAERRAVSPDADAEMLRVLRGQEFNDKIPAGLPPDIPVAHKTGSITRISHDAGVVYPPDGVPYVLVVLTRGFDDEDEANRRIAAVSKAIWEHHRTRGSNPE